MAPQLQKTVVEVSSKLLSCLYTEKNVESESETPCGEESNRFDDWITDGQPSSRKKSKTRTPQSGDSTTWRSSSTSVSWPPDLMDQENGVLGSDRSACDIWWARQMANCIARGTYDGTCSSDDDLTSQDTRTGVCAPITQSTVKSTVAQETSDETTQGFGWDHLRLSSDHVQFAADQYSKVAGKIRFLSRSVKRVTLDRNFKSFDNDDKSSSFLLDCQNQEKLAKSSKGKEQREIFPQDVSVDSEVKPDTFLSDVVKFLTKFKRNLGRASVDPSEVSKGLGENGPNPPSSSANETPVDETSACFWILVAALCADRRVRLVASQRKDQKMAKKFVCSKFHELDEHSQGKTSNHSSSSDEEEDDVSCISKMEILSRFLRLTLCVWSWVDDNDTPTSKQITDMLDHAVACFSRTCSCDQRKSERKSGCQPTKCFSKLKKMSTSRLSVVAFENTLFEFLEAVDFSLGLQPENIFAVAQKISNLAGL